MEKPILYYGIRVHVNRLTGGTLYVPAIVDREDAVPLDVIIERAIDRGLIAGIKTSAAQQIADALALQMYEEFKSGRGVKFGNYFYARLYLDGTSDSDGKLTKDNDINVRFVSGPGFKLTMDMFSFSNIAVIFNGFNLWKEGDTGTKVSWFLVDPDTGKPAEEAAAEVTSFLSMGPNSLKFAWPGGLAAGSTYLAVPSRSADGERWFVGAGKNATVKEVE